ncbi:GerAB/ArcD/ProY family transporter [Heyndrickxia sporothermodurans]
MQTIPENRKISPQLIFFTIHGMQFGVGILGFQRIIAQTAGYDSWMSIIIAGLSTAIIMWLMMKIVEIGDKDLAGTQIYVFGKWLGTLFNIFFILYYTLYMATIVRTYIEVVQVWMFADLNVFIFSFFFLILCIYIVSGGFRTVTAMMFFSVALPSYLVILFAFTLPYADFRHFLPMFNHSFKEVIIASGQMSLTYLGYETFLVYYPFIKNYEKSKKWAFISLTTSCVLFLYIAVISFAYYSEEQIQKYIWATLTTWKIVHLPVVERFEYVGIANWCLIILPNTSLALWCASRLVKQTLKISQRKSIYVLSLIAFIGVQFFITRQQIDILSTLVGKIGFLVTQIYIPILFILLIIVKKVKKKI